MLKTSLLVKSATLALSLAISASPSFAQISTLIQEAYYPKVIHTQGDVQIKQEPEPGQPVQWMQAEKGMQIRPGAQIKTKGKSQLDIGVANKYQMRIKEKSDVIAGSLAFNTQSRTFDTQYTIKEGSLYNRIQKDYLGEFKIESPNLNVTAMGTEYGLDVWGPQQQTWFGLAQGEVQATDTIDNEKLNIPQGDKIDLGKGEEGKLAPMPDYELQGLRQELDKIGTGVDEDLDVRVFFILNYSANRAYEFLDGAALLTNNNEPRRIKQLFIPTVRMLPNKVANKQAILANLKKIVFACEGFNDPRYTPHFLSYTGVIYHLLGEDKETEKLFTQVLAQYPDFQYASILQCALGIVYERFLNDPKKAIEAYRTVVAKYPGTLEVETAQLALTRLGE